MKPLRHVLLTCTLAAHHAHASPPQQPTDELTARGQQLAARYTRELDATRRALLRACPKAQAPRATAFRKAVQGEKTAEAALAAAQQDLGRIDTAQALVQHAKGKWIGGADRGIQAAQAALARATTAAERQTAREDLAKWQANREDGEKALAEREAALRAARNEEPALRRALATAEADLIAARTRARAALRALRLDPSLGSDQLDDRLAKFGVLREATPEGLARFAQQSRDCERLCQSLLADTDLMRRMLTADGANGGQYGRAMQLYTQILDQHDQAHDGALQRLALAIALEHAVPIPQRNPVAARDTAPATVDPIARYRHYEQAYLAGELDACFDHLTTWDYRMVVDGNEPDATLAWGRQMLRSYRPDHVHTKDDRWRYVAAVRTDIRYGSQDNRYDRDDLQFFQNILMNGGVCGRRAFFGRFILRAFGVPTTARPQRGHAALAHWTPRGWVVCLGAGWGSGWTKTRYDRDLDFLATTQARAHMDRYMEVKRAQWIGDVHGETPVYGLQKGMPGFWYGVSLYHQRDLIEELGAVTLAPVGEELGEANESTHARYAFEAAAVTDADRQVAVSEDGTITAPAVSCCSPEKSNGKILFLPSNLGGKQLHYSRTGRPQPFEYEIEVPTGGIYELTLRVATPSWQQHLLLQVNGSDADAAIDIALPHTIGLWGQTEPVDVSLKPGRNVLRFEHRSDGQAKGFSLRDLTLTPSR